MEECSFLAPYNGFGYYYSNKTAMLEILLPAPEPGDGYNYEIYNISSRDRNGIVVNLKRDRENGEILINPEFNLETVRIDLLSVRDFENTEETTEPINYTKPIIVYIFHDDTEDYNENNRFCFNLLRGNIFPIDIPRKLGMGIVKRVSG